MTTDTTDTIYPDPDVTLPRAYMCISFVASFILVKGVSPLLSPVLHPPYAQFGKPKQLDWDSRLASNVHAVLVCIILYFIFRYDEEIYANPAWGECLLARIACGIVIGYLGSDTLIILLHYKDIGDVAYLFHHLATMLPYYFVMNYGVMIYFAMYRLWAELSTPFVNKRWIMETLCFGKSSTLYIGNGVVMAITFFASRIAPIPYYYYYILDLRHRHDYYSHLHNYMIIAVSTCMFLDVLNVAWMLKILRGVRKVLKARYAMDKNENKVKEN